MTIKEFLYYIPFVRIFVRRPRAAAKPLKGFKHFAITAVVESISLLIVYCMLSPAFAMPLYNQLIFHPISEKDDLTDQIQLITKYFDCKFTDLRFKAPDGETLHGWYFARTGSKKTIILSHGNGGCIDQRLALCPVLLQTGASVFLYDYEGFGKSTGSPTLANICDDGVAAFDYVAKNLRVPTSDIVLYGESIGAGVTSEVSTKRTPGAIILQSGFTSLAEAGADRVCFLKLYPSWVFPNPQLSNLEIMKHPHAPLLIIHGKKDDMLTYHYAERIMEAAAEPKQLLLLPEAGHVDIYKTDVALTLPALTKFISTLP
jgi:fermentation-respiration switch protein FrsA (DUF1100 family)